MNLTPLKREEGRENDGRHGGKFSRGLEATTKIKCIDYSWVSLFNVLLFPTDTGSWKWAILALKRSLFEKIMATQWMIYVAG